VITPPKLHHGLGHDQGRRTGLEPATLERSSPLLLAMPQHPHRNFPNAVFLLPTATDSRLGAEKWGAGPTAVLLKQVERPSRATPPPTLRVSTDYRAAGPTLSICNGIVRAETADWFTSGSREGLAQSRGPSGMPRELALFTGTFTTLLAIINPLEVLPVYLKLLSGKDGATHRSVARKACTYTLLLCFLFLIFGTLILRLFGVPLSMLQVAGGIILMRIGFTLMSGTGAGPSGGTAGSDIAFVPLAMPLMFGPGAIATIISMTASIEDLRSEAPSFIAVAAAIFATMFVTYLFLAYAEKLTKMIGPMGIDACTRIVGFFVSAMGVSLMFVGIVKALEMHGVTTLH
jgi:multiple antibiotic resistance protein